MSEVAGVLLGVWYWVKDGRVSIGSSLLARWPRDDSYLGVAETRRAKEPEEGEENINEAVHIFQTHSHLLQVHSLFFPPTSNCACALGLITADPWYATNFIYRSRAILSITILNNFLYPFVTL